MTVDRDPDRRRPPPPHPGFVQKPLDFDLDMCVLCKALVPATEVARLRHLEWDQKIIQLLQQSGSGREPSPGTLSGPDPASGGSRTRTSDLTAADASPPDPTPEAGEREPGSTVGTDGDTPRDLRHDPASGSYAPTPPPGDHSRSGVEGANQDRPGASLLPGTTTPPDPHPPRGSGGTNRSRPERHPGRGVSTAGREPRTEEDDQAAYEDWLALQAGGS